MPMAKNRPPGPAPLTRERVFEAIRKIGGKAQKRDIAHELGIGADQKKELRHILRELEESGALGRTGRKRYADAQALPESGVMDIVDRDPDGELLARMRGPEGYFGPVIRLAPGDARRMKGEAAIGTYDGYDPLLYSVVHFFRTGVAPVEPDETLEIYAFMEAADESKRRGGAEVTLKEVMDKALAEARK